MKVGRSTESPIDFVVTDTISGSQNNDETQITQSTISRFACRIVCDRSPPYTARIFAAGFDSSKNIFLGEKAAKWKNPDGHMDGLTTNGVLVMHPKGGFTEESKPGVWREISVCGDVYTLRETRSAQQRGKLVENETNVLQDGSLIDLCGATLLWRTADGLFHTPTQKHIEALRQEINAARPQCPVGLNTLAFPSINRKDVVEEKQPWAYLSCGHVHGYHNWGHRSDTEANERECPMCRTIGPYVPLWLGCEAGFYVDAGPPTHAFTPCGHVCSEKSAKYWSQIPLPHAILYNTRSTAGRRTLLLPGKQTSSVPLHESRYFGTNQYSNLGSHRAQFTGKAGQFVALFFSNTTATYAALMK
ncbi:E3 ubiquitin-protein ligase pellino homolog 2 isoform X5 [Strix uralensis]|uniref:E3 ubiquitin-protein ligase pellino homolog 2 isoform X5 n=1 Tax=Strix uralensis TaxID=36305 RepID=UPI003DA70D3D